MKNIYMIFCALLITSMVNAQNNSYRLNETDAVCTAVETFSAINQTNNSVDVVWSPSPTASSYKVSYRLLTDTILYAVSVADDSLASLYSLDSCSGYEFFITTICADLTELESVHDTFYTKCDTLELGIISSELQSRLLFYPNPATGSVSVNLSEVVYGEILIKIYNSMGRIEEEYVQVLNGENRLVNLDISRVEPGINYFTIWYNDKVKTGQIVVYR